MTVVRKTQLNSDDTKGILESEEMVLSANAIDEIRAEKASVEVGQTMCKEILRSEIAKLDEDFAGEKKHKSERVENLSAKKTSKSIESKIYTKKSECISQTENEFEFCGGTKIEDCVVRKKRKVNEKSIGENLAKPSGEESIGDENVTKAKVKTLYSGEKNLNSKTNTTVENQNNISLSKKLTSQQLENQVPSKDTTKCKNVIDKEKKVEVANETVKAEVSKNMAVVELEKGVLIAVRVLVEMMSDETATNALKVDCAKEILTRLYGKTFEKTNDACEIEISQELREYCE